MWPEDLLGVGGQDLAKAGASFLGKGASSAIFLGSSGRVEGQGLKSFGKGCASDV